MVKRLPENLRLANRLVHQGLKHRAILVRCFFKTRNNINITNEFEAGSPMKIGIKCDRYS